MPTMRRINTIRESPKNTPLAPQLAKSGILRKQLSMLVETSVDANESYHGSSRVPDQTFEQATIKNTAEAKLSEVQETSDHGNYMS